MSRIIEIGRYEVNGKETMFQTSNTSLRLPASATVTIKAISSEQRLLQTITPDSKPAAPNAEKAMVTLSEPAPTEAPAPTEMPRKEEAEAEAEEVPAESPVELYNFHSNINIGLGFGKETLDLQGDAALNNTANITGTRVAGQLSWNRLTHGWHFNLSGFVHKFIAETVVLADGSKLSEQKFNRMRFDVTATYERMVSDFGIGLAGRFVCPGITNTDPLLV